MSETGPADQGGRLLGLDYFGALMPLVQNGNTLRAAAQAAPGMRPTLSVTTEGQTNLRTI
jgi:hypothetical protein